MESFKQCELWEAEDYTDKQMEVNKYPEWQREHEEMKLIRIHDMILFVYFWFDCDTKFI